MTACQLSTPEHHLILPQAKTFLYSYRDNFWSNFSSPDWWVTEQEKKRGWQMLLFQKGGSCWLPSSSAFDLQCCVCPSSSPPTDWGDFNQQLWHTHTHTEQEEQKVKGSGRKLKEHWKGSVKTLRDRWGSRKRTNKLDLEKGKGHEKDTEDAKNAIHSTLTYPLLHLSV